MRYASAPFLMNDRPSHRNRFFATCCVMVDAPRSRPPRWRLSIAFPISSKSKPEVQVEAVIFGGEDGAPQVG